MDLTPTREQEAFRTELRAWLAEHPPDADLRAHHEDLAQEVVDLRQWQARLAEGRWIGVTWPEEYGGRGAGALHHFIVQAELAPARAPELVGRIGVNLVGPTLLAHGTPEQKARWLPRILAADDLWCQLFSEP
ncbi:MAG: acyl-CoA dehydrogenase family protein, partial [Acidimicrobiales bacterium]